VVGFAHSPPPSYRLNRLTGFLNGHIYISPPKHRRFLRNPVHSKCPPGPLPPESPPLTATPPSGKIANKPRPFNAFPRPSAVLNGFGVVPVVEAELSVHHLRFRKLLFMHQFIYMYVDKCLFLTPLGLRSCPQVMLGLGVSSVPVSNLLTASFFSPPFFVRGFFWGLWGR